MKIYDEALRTVNQLRVKAGAEPLEKLRHGTHDANFCPLTNSLRPCGVTAISTACVEFDDGTAAAPSSPLKAFIRAFDHGCFRELEI